ncbi:HNH endonuclease [uncultured Clostridium sp.]|uniref:HNH endonuclease n=1 Tax=uncultured Clostridium sp. TaxID=59620 RepID=UPI00260752FB|nr:HNH endonuclease signature motif containing protein [uncultured Clostridium sp.]
MGYRQNYFENTPSNYGWYKCVRCSKKFRKKDIDVDHIIPKKYKGSDKLYNLQSMCKHCNRSKGAKVRNTPIDLTKNIIKRIKIKSKKRAS